MEEKDYYSKNTWVFRGLIWGSFMFLVMEIVFPLIEDEPFELKTVLVGLIVWGLAGLLYGYTMYRYYHKSAE